MKVVTKDKPEFYAWHKKKAKIQPDNKIEIPQIFEHITKKPKLL